MKETFCDKSAGSEALSSARSNDEMTRLSSNTATVQASTVTASPTRKMPAPRGIRFIPKVMPVGVRR
jgi:hypothetical protein